MPPENELENELKNDLENEGNRISDGKNAAKNENAFLENDSEMTVENAEKMTVENDSEMDEELEGYFLDPDDFEDEFEDELESPSELETGEDELEDEFDFPEEDEEFDFPEEEDPLDDAISSGSEDTPVDDLLSEITGDSAKNLELLEELGDLAMEKIDNSKAMLCSAISGESPARYASDKKLNQALLKAFANYLRSNNVKKPSPLGSLLLVLAMWGLPTLGAAFFHRSKAKKAAKKQALKKSKAAGDSIVEDIEIEGEAQSDSEEGSFDYTNLKEHQENRQIFTVHKTSGCYNRTPKGQFARITLASEKPSPEIQRMLEEGLSSGEIRERIYNE